MLKKLAILILLLLGATAAIAAMTNSNRSRFEVAGQEFEIPRNHLFDMTIPWLPVSRSGNFTFLLEPNPAPNLIPAHRFLVQSVASHCNRDRESLLGMGQMMRIVCGVEEPKISDAPPYKQIPTDLGDWSTDLVATGANESGATRQVADCQKFEPNPAKPNGATNCNAVWGYDNLLIQVDFDISEANQLPALKHQAETLLDRWRVK
jgi:hypothetical protein